VDGARAILKREIKKEKIKLQGKNLKNVDEIVKSLKSKTNKYHATNSNARKKIKK
jgi:hypothetical protein